IDATLAGTNTYSLLYRRDEDFSIPYLAGKCGFYNDINHVFHQRCRNNDFKLDFGQEVHHILGIAIQFRMAFLSTKSLDFGNRHSTNTDVSQCFPYFIQFKRLNNGRNELHLLLTYENLWQA